MRALSDMIGAPRHYVEEMLGRSSLELKKEVKDGNKRICYYGDWMEEEGYWQYIYENDQLVSYRKLEDVLAKQFKRRITRDLEKHIVAGMSKEETERKIKKMMYLDPIGKEELSEKGTSQKYGGKHYGQYQPIIIVYYDKNGLVLDSKYIRD